jgi:Na+/H+ antiporter NhaC
MSPDGTSLIPPLVAIALAAITHRVILPIAAGVFAGAILLTGHQADASWWTPLYLFVNSIYLSVSDWSHFQAFIFSLLLGGMVGVLEKCGGMQDVIARLVHRIRSRTGAQLMIWFGGLLIFFDDYANSLLLGGTMRSTVDRYGVSRAKLAYLVDSTAAPVAGLAVVSTWAVTEITYMSEGLVAGGVTDPSAPFALFIASIPYRFYPWLALVLVFLIAVTGRDFGPMSASESRAMLASSKSTAELPQPSVRPLWIAAVVPVLLCLNIVGGVLVFTGLQNLPIEQRSERWLQFAGQVLGKGDSYDALVWGSAGGVVSAILLHAWLTDLTHKRIAWSVIYGMRQMLPAMIVLWLAWTLSSMTGPKNLNTGGFLSGILSSRLESWMLPTVVFLISGGVAFATGTSWGTMAILTPISVELALRLDASHGAEGIICLATTGSVLAGAIFGDHCSPISDTTVLSSRASDCDHMEHVRTQMPYALVVAIVCIIFGTLPVAFGMSPYLLMVISIGVLWGIMRFFGRLPESESDPIALE